MNVKVEWRSASEDSGVLSAMTAGTQLMLRLSVDSLGLPLKVRLHHVKKELGEGNRSDNAEREWPRNEYHFSVDID